jgi:hypothetical protein
VDDRSPKISRWKNWLLIWQKKNHSLTINSTTMDFQQFKYKKAFKIPYRNCYFDSLLELKFALSIENDFRYLRAPCIIGYDPRTFVTTSYLRETTRLYTPDFMVRCKESGKARIIEIKPDQLKHSTEVNKYYRIMNDYIVRNNLDCTFEILSEKDIHLTGEQQQRFAVFEKNRQRFESHFAFRSLDRKYNAGSIKYFSSVPLFPADELARTAYAKFVRHGFGKKAA